MRIPFLNLEVKLPAVVSRIAPGAKLKTPAPYRGEEFSQKPVVKPGHVRMFASAQVSRLTGDWPVSISSADSEVLVSAIATRSRMRQLERDDDYMRRMLRLYQNNVIGHQGIQLQMKIKNSSAAGGKPSYDTDANTAVQTAWKNALKPKNCCVNRSLSGVQLQRMVIRAVKRDGAILIRIFRGFKNDFAFALQPLEIDFLNFFFCGRAPGSGNLVKFGIEYDQYDAPVAFWILSRHPGEVFSQDNYGKTYQTRVPASDILIIQDFDRANQRLGMPDLCSVATRLNMLHKTLEAVAVATRAGAAKMGFIEREKATEYEGKVDPEGNPIEELSPGSIEQLGDGEKFVGFDPKQPTEALQPFVKEELRGASAGAGLDYAAVANDRESENYSSLKAGRLETKAQYEWDQMMITEQLMQPWFEEWLPFAIASGQLEIPATKIQKILDGENWQPRVWASVEPMKEVQADLLEISGKLASRREKIAERGRNIEDVDEELQEDFESLKAHGLDQLDAVKPVIQSGPETPDGEAKPGGAA